MPLRLSRTLMVGVLTLVAAMGGSCAAWAAGGPPAAWSDIDIGAAGTAGSHTYNNGAFTVTGGGKGPDSSGKDQL
ncbi:MAG: hypothetical protein M3Y56_10130, partial [Armatimonadota bacterium]|nr:hypothetical protein [Armatimonadota bacterium]